MELCIFVEPQQGTTYERVCALARHAEALGYTGFFSSDHLLAMGGRDGLPGPLDTWTTLAGLARDTTRLRLGPLVTPVTFRHPGLLAVTVAQVDAMSGGRLEVGLGAGWYEAEHHAHGLAFPPAGERLTMLEEQLAVLAGWWSTPAGERVDVTGLNTALVASPALPKPVQQPHPPVILGGRGPRRTPRLAARYADEFNVTFSPVEVFVEQRDRVRAACDEAGRDPATMRFSVALVLCCGDDEATFRRRADAIGRAPDELRQNGACGTPDEVAATLRAYRDAGAARVYLQTLDDTDHDHLSLVAEAVAPALR